MSKVVIILNRAQGVEIKMVEAKLVKNYQYMCEGCGELYSVKIDAMNCEKSHSRHSTEDDKLDKQTVINRVRDDLKKHRNFDPETLANLILLKCGCTRKELGLDGDTKK